jgi:hypothetical protein
MLLRDFIVEAVAEIQAGLMAAFAPAFISCRNPPCSVRFYVHDGEADLIDQRVISSPTSRWAATISASATVPAEIRISTWDSNRFMQASASLAPRAIGINADVSTAIIPASHPRHIENPGSSRRPLQYLPWFFLTFLQIPEVSCALLDLEAS